MKQEYFDIARSKCTHPELKDEEWRLFYEHFLVFPWSELGPDPVGFELGCGTGLWAQLLAQQAQKVIGLDHRDEEIQKAKSLAGELNLDFRSSDFFDLGGIRDDSMDFGVALETLHLSPDLPRTLSCCTRKLKLGAPLLIYLLYLPETPWGRIKARSSDLKYRAKHRHSMDRRYAKLEVIELMKNAGLERVQFSPVGSYWTAVGFRRS
jgi:SAM-dependent methyltransferase